MLLFYSLSYKSPSAQCQKSTVGLRENRESRKSRRRKKGNGAGWRRRAPVVLESKISVPRVLYKADADTLPPGEQAFSAGAEKAQRAQEKKTRRSRERSKQKQSRAQNLVKLVKFWQKKNGTHSINVETVNIIHERISFPHERSKNGLKITGLKLTG